MLVTNPGSPSFESYASVDDLRDLAASRGYDVPVDDESCEQLLLQGMDYLAGLIWKGSRTVAGQPLFWPRTGVVVDGYLLPKDVIPKQIIQAQCRLAVEAQEIDLSPAFAGGGEVTQETVVGAVSGNVMSVSFTFEQSFKP
ncbi:DnaT-like ssDNA-binding protein [Yersinia enterocolitica]